MDCRGRGAERPVGRRAKATLLWDKSKSSNVGDCGRTSPTREKEEHSGASEDSGRYLFDTHTHTFTHTSTQLQVTVVRLILSCPSSTLYIYSYLTLYIYSYLTHTIQLLISR